VISLAVMMHVRFPLWLRNADELLFERGIVFADIQEL
jgi:transposase-like protein